MSLKEEQATEYLEEAALSLDSAIAIFDEACRTGKRLWAQVVKTAYDGMEAAISAALAARDVMIPKDHPEKISKFVNSYNAKGKLAGTLFFWLRKRGKSQYVDVRAGKVAVPHKSFDEGDADQAIADCKFVIGEIKRLLKIE